jgi:prepilin-type N-terminal cleavage/methylation domain-containing protein
MLKRRRGFTVLEVIVALFMLAIISAAVIPTLMRRIRDAEKSALAQTLFSLSLALVEFRKAVSVNPSQLAYLAAQPQGTDRDACNNQFNGNEANWRGPYITRDVIAGGVGIGDSQIQNALRRASGPPVRLYIDVTNVDAAIAADLDAQFDGATASPTTGTVRYTTGSIPATLTSALIPAAATGMVNLSYGIPITGC